jgi:hypothetical protein
MLCEATRLDLPSADHLTKGIPMRKLAVCLAVAIVALLSVPMLRAQPADEFSGAKWEYARLLVRNGECTIEMFENTRTATSPQELYEKVFGVRGAKPFKNDSTLLTRIGGNGWELTGTFSDGSHAVYVFKRAVR